MSNQKQIECPKCSHVANRTAGSSLPDMGFIKGWFCSYCGSFVRDKSDNKEKKDERR